jgi:drug/metabolite transporter (DMT)-like permease
MKQESFATGALFMTLSASALAVTGLLGKIGIVEFSLTGLIFWRFFLGFLICLPSFWLLGYLKEGIHVSNFKLHILRAAFGLGAQYCFYYYLQMNSLLNALTLLNTGPIFIPIIEFAVLRKHVGKSSWIAVFISFIGVICLLQPDKGIFSLSSLIGLLSGVLQGSSQVLFGINAKTERAELNVLVLFFLCFLLSLVPYLLVGPLWTLEPGLGLWPIGLIVALGCASLFNQSWRANAYQHSTPSRLAVFLYFAVLLAGFLDWLVFHRIPNTLSLLGALLVVLGGISKIYLRGRFTKKKSQE